MPNKTLFLVAFFKFADNPGHGFKRIELQAIFETEAEARDKLGFCDEAGWFEGALIEECYYGNKYGWGKLKRIWLIQQEDGSMKETEEPKEFKNVWGIIG